MKRSTKKQWLWFLGLWCGGVAAMFILAQAVRWIISI
jgi:hypothetical protein